MCCDACCNHFKYSNVPCCFADAEGYSCRHKGDSNFQVRSRVPESERKNFPEDARCCNACCNHFKCSNVTCCFADAEGYSCRHKGKSNVRAIRCVPESERRNFPEEARCCDACCIALIEKKNLDLENLCHKCAAGVYGQKRKRGGKHVTTCPIFNDELWTCEACKNKARWQRWYRKKCAEQGKPRPKFYRKRQY